MTPRSSIVLASCLVLLSATSIRCLGGINFGLEADKEVSIGGGHGGGGVHEEDALKGFFQGMANGFPLDLFGKFGAKAEAKKEVKEAAIGNLIEKKVAAKEEAKESFLGIKGEALEFIKLFNPIELINKIVTFFKLEKLEFLQAIGKACTFGLEIALQPALISIKIVEKVFVPDACKLKFICELGKPIAFLKGGMPKFSPAFFEGASTVRAFNDGATGCDCQQLYQCGGELKLKKEFELLKAKSGNGGGGAGLGGKLSGSKSVSFDYQGGARGGEEDLSYASSNDAPAKYRNPARM